MTTTYVPGRGRPRITSRAVAALDQLEEQLKLPYRRSVTTDWRLARVCNWFVTRAARSTVPA